MAIERKFIAQNIREFMIKEFVEEEIDRVGLSDATLKKTPLGDKIVIAAARPGLVVGRGGANIQALTKRLKNEFNLDNPQIEIAEVEKPDLDANVVAERIMTTLERFGSGRTKGIGHRTMMDVMNAGALGVEILISGKIPSMRSRRWRFYAGYLKKSGDIAIEGVSMSKKSANLKQGAVGIQVRIMPPDLVLPDHIKLTESPTEEIEETEESSEPAKAEKKPQPKKEDKPKKASKKPAKPAKKKSEVKETPKGKSEEASVPETKDSGTEDKK